MSSHCQNPRGRVAVLWLVVVAVFCGVGTLATAQDQPAPKWELFGGYSFFHPGADVHGVLPGGVLPVSSRLEPNPRGVGASATYNFNRWFGLTLDASTHWGSGENTIGTRIDDVGLSNLSLGPKITFRSTHFSPFLEALVGDHRLMPEAFHHIDKLGFMLGGGLDVNLSQHIALRLLRADFVMSSYRYGPSSTTPSTDIRGARLQTGIVFMFGGGGPAVPVAASCSVSSGEVMVGEPVTATVTASNFHKDRALTYNWSSTGGKVTPKDATATIDTTGVAGGSYTVTARVTDPKAKKNGEATCSANFTVKEPPKNPPTMTCSANPATVQAGTPSTITCDCKSPDNVPVTVAEWNASAGKVTGSANTGTLDTTGAAAGPITVSAKCADSRGLSTDGNATVTVEQPPPPPTASKLNSCDFPNKKKPWRVDNTCKAILDDVALRLQNAPDAKLVIVGNQAPNEKRKNLAAERAVDSKAYLSGGEAKQAIDPSRIETRTGSGGTTTADYWLVPAGATFNEPGTQPVDEKKVKAIPDHPARKAPARKKAAKPATP